jgi:MFS transporter, Spinster family, sphingosine-1-phosphate transporter
VTKRYLGYALAVIFIANFFSYLDRQIVSALKTELQTLYKLDNKGFGLLWTMFTVGYMVFAPIVGFLTDRYRRTRIFAVCVFLWSLATIGSGYAPNKQLLFAMRFFIGIGEAGCLVIGPTLLSDFFPKESRGKALAVFFLGLPLGGTAGYLVGGELHENIKTAFLVAGLPGFAIAALIWFLVDPPRGGEGAGHHAPIKGIRPYVDLFRNKTLILIIIAQACAVTFLVPLLHFGVGFFVEERNIPTKEATRLLGIIALVAGAAGNLLSGWLGDRFARKGIKGSYAILAGIAFIAGLPFLLVGFTAHAKWIFLPSLGAGAFCYFLCMPAVNTQIANAVSAQQRAMAYALAVFILHLLGDTSAPYLFGAAVDALHNTQKAFFIFSWSLLLAGCCCLLAARFAARDQDRADLARDNPNPANQT